MIELLDEPLSSHTSMRVGGVTNRLCIPESEKELVDLLSAKDREYFVLGRGSNTIFKDGRYEGTVIKNTRACKQIIVVRSARELLTRYYWLEVGSSVSNQSLLKYCKNHGLDGPAFLQSVPGNIGGTIVMNGGTGIHEGRYISDYVVSVKVFDGDKTLRLSHQQCEFAFRSSIFQENRWVILSAMLKVPVTSVAKITKKIKNRMEFAKQWQDLGYPNTGSVYKIGYKHFKELSGLTIGGAMFSRKTANWIINLGNASSADVLGLVTRGAKLHEDAGLPAPVCEWVVVDTTQKH